MSAQSISVSPDVLEQAIAWSVRLHAKGNVDGEVSRALTEWRLASLQHEHAWQAIQASERDLLGARSLPPRLLMETLEAGSREVQVRRRQVLKLLGLASVGVGTAWLVSAEAVRTGWRADYATANGERRILRLADGTSLHLNMNTAVDIRFDAQERRILLRRGEVLIDTGKDVALNGRRRFWVDTAEGHLEAIGTRFLVRQENDSTRLQVEEGAVAVYRDNRVQHLAHAGDACEMRDNGAVQVLADDGFDHAAWSEGVLAAKQMRLADFLDELSRYRSGWLRCDPAVADLRVSGVFQLTGDDPSTHVLEALSASLPVRIEMPTRYWTTVRAR